MTMVPTRTEFRIYFFVNSKGRESATVNVWEFVPRGWQWVRAVGDVIDGLNAKFVRERYTGPNIVVTNP